MKMEWPTDVAAQPAVDQQAFSMDGISPETFYWSSSDGAALVPELQLPAGTLYVTVETSIGIASFDEVSSPRKHYVRCVRSAPTD
jgi:hypothetical protein